MFPGAARASSPGAAAAADAARRVPWRHGVDGGWGPKDQGKNEIYMDLLDYLLWEMVV